MSIPRMDHPRHGIGSFSLLRKALFAGMIAAHPLLALPQYMATSI